MSSVIDRTLEYSKPTEVGKNEFKKSDDELLAADGLGTCLGIGVYDSAESTAYLLHAGTRENDMLDRQVDSFISEFYDLESSYEIFLGGTIAADFDPLTDNDYTRHARNLVEQKLQGKGLNYEKDWNDMPTFNRMVVDPEIGILYDIPEPESIGMF